VPQESAAPPSVTPHRTARPDAAGGDGRTDAPAPTLEPTPGTPEAGPAPRRPPNTGRDPAVVPATGRREGLPAEPRPATPAADEPTLRPGTAAETDRSARAAPSHEDPRDDAPARDGPRPAAVDSAPALTSAPPPAIVEGIRPRLAPPDADPRRDAPARTGPRPAAVDSSPAPSPAPPPAIVEGIRPRLALDAAAGGGDEAAAGPPPIHVSIGRIEVRAVRPEPKPRPPRERPAPMVSLDEYLENGGIPV